MKPTKTDLRIIEQITNTKAHEDDYFIFEAKVTNNAYDRLGDFQGFDFCMNVAEKLGSGKVKLLLEHEYHAKSLLGYWYDSFVTIDNNRFGADGKPLIEVTGRAFILNIEANQHIIKLVEHGLLKGLSIGFSCEEHDFSTGEFIGLNELYEVSLVAFPALFNTEISTKSTTQAKALNFGFTY